MQILKKVDFLAEKNQKKYIIAIEGQTSPLSLKFMQQIKLTEHFNLAEFTRSATAEANGIKNSLDNNNQMSARTMRT